MICYLFPKPIYFLFSSDVPALLYYTYIPTTAVVLLIGFYVLWNNKYSLLNQLLFLISILFSFWTMSALIEWTNIYSDFVLFIWNFQGVIFGLIAIFSIYFIYVFLNKKDISAQSKITFLILLAPIFILTPTFYLKGFDITNCDAFEFSLRLFEIYYTLLGPLAMIWILVMLIRKYRTTEVYFRKQILLIGIGMELFLFLFFLWTSLIYYLTSVGVLLDSRLEMYGMLGMVVFIGLLAYSIVKYKAFNIKLLGAQALVAGIIILIASQFAFIQNPTNRILTGITLAIVALFGWWLVKAVKKENEQNELLIAQNAMIAKQKDKIEHDKRLVEKANEELITLDKSKTDFINIASHQLQTPISVIQGVTSMMMEGDLDKMPQEKRQMFYKSVWEKSQKLKTIIHDILNAASFTNRKFNVMDQSAESVDVAGLLQKIIGDFAMEVKARDVDLTFNAKNNIPKIRGQKEYLEEAFINLINNAIKYTPSSKMTNDVRALRQGSEKAAIAVSLQKDKDNPKNILAQIKDNGIGIPEEAKPKLFNRFARAKNAVSMYTDGSGLGLFIVKEIIEGHGGKIWLESEVGKGTTFFVSLPIKFDKKIDIKERIVKNSATNQLTK